MFTAVFAAAAPLLLAVPFPPVTEPEIWTDKPGYLAGDPIHISGEGFSPFERVTLQAIHEDGTAEAGAGHDAFFVSADAEGSFQGAWSISREEMLGLHFALTAEGASGLSAKTAFSRVGEISANKSAESVRLKAQGFNANEPVSLKLDDGHDHPALAKFSDDSGTLVAELDLPGDSAMAAVFTVTAASSRSGLTLTATITDYTIVNRKPNGVPALEELRAQSGLAQIGYQESDLRYDLFVTWNSPGRNGNVCALFDSGGDASGGIDFAICAPSVPGAASGSLSVFTCDNERADRCGNPAPYGAATQVQTHIRASWTSAANRTLRFRVDRSFLPPDAELASVCSYASETSDRDNGPLDCIAVPDDNNALVVSAASAGPALTGRIAYHSYVSYNDGTSQLFILNLATTALTNISSGWTNLTDAMNPHWSPDGTKLVFMARPKKGGSYSAWFDVFLYTVGQSGNPVNLTKTQSKHDEDPKFSPDGSRIVYKVRPSTLREMNLSGSILGTIVSSSGNQRSMPYYTSNAAAVWYSNLPSGASGSAASIRKINVNGTGEATVVDTPDVIDFYPIRDTIGQFLYSRTVSASNLYGQVYLFDGAAGTSLPFNTNDADYNDAFPLGTQHIVLSSTKAGGRGGYDLYVADRNTGTMWSLSGYNGAVNTSREELGAAYTPN